MRVKLKKLTGQYCQLSSAQRCGACNMAGALSEPEAVRHIFDVNYERTYVRCDRAKRATA